MVDNTDRNNEDYHSKEVLVMTANDIIKLVARILDLVADAVKAPKGQD